MFVVTAHLKEDFLGMSKVATECLTMKDAILLYNDVVTNGISSLKPTKVPNKNQTCIRFFIDADEISHAYITEDIPF